MNGWIICVNINLSVKENGMEKPMKMDSKVKCFKKNRDEEKRNEIETKIQSQRNCSEWFKKSIQMIRLWQLHNKIVILAKHFVVVQINANPIKSNSFNSAV